MKKFKKPMYSCLSWILLLELIFGLVVAVGLCWAATDAEEGDSSFPDEFEEFEIVESIDENLNPSQTSVNTVPDPLFYYNYAIFQFNDKLYFWVLKPVAKGYGVIVPEALRVSIKNFYYNLYSPVRLINCLLQGKEIKAAHELARSMINTTFGLGGLFDFATQYCGSNVPPKEDLGQTLAVYGIPEGFYFVLPFFGSSNLRDSLGMAGDGFLNPINYYLTLEESVGFLTIDMINKTSFRIGDYETLKKGAIDPYEAFKDANFQYRNKQIAE